MKLDDLCEVICGTDAGYRISYEQVRSENEALRAEVERLRAAAAELAEIKRAWGMAAKDL